MNLPNTTRNSGAASVNSGDTRLAQSGSSAPSVDGIKLRGEASMIKTITGINHSTGQSAQGELMFGNTDSGKPLFWLKGKDTNYVLRGADGKPVTNLMDAEARAGKLISGGGATQLRTVKSALGGPEVKAPDSDGKLRINLEDPALNDKGGSGVSKDGIFGQDRGERGSALTSNDAVQEFKKQGVSVKVFNSNPEGHVKNARMGAMVELSNDARGGAQYAQATAIQGGFQPDAVTYSVPKGASAEFKRGYQDAKVEISKDRLRQGVRQAAEGYITGRSTGAQKVSANARPITTESVQRPAQQAAQSRTTAADSLTVAIKMRLLSNRAQVVGNEKAFDNYLNTIDKQPLTTVLNVGTFFNNIKGSTLEQRSASIQHANSQALPKTTGAEVPELDARQGAKAHDVHTTVGSVSKLGEVHANNRAFNYDSKASWAERSHLPKNGKESTHDFWQVESPKQWKKADSSLSTIEKWAAGSSTPTAEQITSSVRQLSRQGFLPKGSALATRMQRLETAATKHDDLVSRLKRADPSKLEQLQAEVSAAKKDLTEQLERARGSAVQARAEILSESLGTPTTTYELTVRHAAAARYMDVIKARNQENPVFSAGEFRAILAQTKKDAGPADVMGKKWHGDMIEKYTANKHFQEAMAQSQPMKEAWSKYNDDLIRISE